MVIAVLTLSFLGYHSLRISAQAAVSPGRQSLQLSQFLSTANVTRQKRSRCSYAEMLMYNSKFVENFEGNIIWVSNNTSNIEKLCFRKQTIYCVQPSSQGQGHLVRPRRNKVLCNSTAGFFTFRYQITFENCRFCILLEIKICKTEPKTQHPKGIHPPSIPNPSPRRQPIAAAFTISEPKDDYKKAVRLAINRLRSSKSFSNVSINGLKRRVIRIGKRKFKVVFVFRSTYKLEIR